MPGTKNPEVLIVGAGPVGLFAALLLARRGIRVQVVDRDWRSGAHSYALGLHAASVALLDEVGLGKRVLDQAHRVDSVGFYDWRQRRAGIKLTDGGTPALVSAMRQDVLEHLLEGALQDLGVKVLWNHEVAFLEQREGHVAVTLNKLVREVMGYAVAHSEWSIAKTIDLQVPFVIGADGHRSSVRRALGIDFPEVGPAQHFAVFEFRTAADLGHELRIGLWPGPTNVLWPLPDGYGRWSLEMREVLPDAGSRTKHRIGYQLGSAHFPVLDVAQVQSLMAEHAPCDPLQVEAVTWHIAVRFERRLATSFGQQRLWLAGDAGHMAGPVGMQSMNVGLREAHELAGILQSVLRQGAPGDRLEEYGRGRMAEWRHLLGIEGGLRATAAADPMVAAACDRILPCLPASGTALGALAAQIGLAV